MAFTIMPRSASPLTDLLISERDAIAPSVSGGARCLAYPTVIDPEAPPIRPERRRKLDRDHQKTPHRRAREIPRAMSMLSVNAPTTCNPIAFMTQ